MTRSEPDSAEFGRLLKSLDPDTGKAWNQYDLLRRKLVRYFEGYRCEDAEALACEVLDRIAKRPDLESIRSIPQFAVGVARNLRRECYAKQQRETHIEDYPAGAESIADPRDCGENLTDNIDNTARLSCLEASLDKLNERDRILAVEYYNAEGIKQYVGRRMLAARYGFSLNGLRVHMNRLRDRLEREVIERLDGSSRVEGAPGQGF